VGDGTTESRWEPVAVKDLHGAVAAAAIVAAGTPDVIGSRSRSSASVARSRHAPRSGGAHSPDWSCL
jgi:hypothetical protein